ncbi:MAG: VRR-NUC domain-containing protein [Treponema sp.]|nr:VRR-NUC domain-containing protein [Treponema sp.]
MMAEDKVESIVQKECLQILSAYNIFHWRQNSGGIFVHGHYYKITSVKGVSDIIGILPDGRFIAVEVKRSKGGRVSEDQKQFLSAIEQNHGIALVINDSKILEEKLKELLNR